MPFCGGCAAYNFDHPDAFDTAAMLECLNNLKVPARLCAGLGVFHLWSAQPPGSQIIALQDCCFTLACFLKITGFCGQGI